MPNIVASPSVRKLIDIDEECYLLQVVKHGWGGEYQLPIGQVVVDGRAVDIKRISKNRTNLIPNELKAVIGAAWAQIDNVLNRRTRAVGAIGSFRALPVATLAGWRDDWDEAISEWNKHIQVFCSRYPKEVLEWNREFWEPFLGDHYGMIARHMPTPDAIRNKFSVAHQLYDFPKPAKARSGLSQRDKAWVEAAAYNAQEQLDQDALKLYSNPPQQLIEQLDAVEQQLREGKRVGAKTFTKLRNIITLIQAFKSIADESVLDEIAKLDRAILDILYAVAERPASVTDTAVIKECSGPLITVIGHVRRVAEAAISAESIKAKFGTAGRGILLRRPG